MAKQIKRIDITEDDIFKNIRESAEKTEAKLKDINEKFKDIATTIKVDLKNAKFGSSSEINEFIKNTKTANDLAKEQIKISQELNKVNKIKVETDKIIVQQNKELDKLNQQLSDSTDDVVKAKLRYQKASAEQRKALADEIILNDKNAGTLEKLAAQNRKLRREREKLNLDTQEGLDRLKEINEELDKNNELIKENSDALKRQTLNVGNYTESIQEATGELGGMIGKIRSSIDSIKDQLKAIRDTAKATDGATSKFKAFGLALKATGIGLIIGLLGSMSSALGDTRKGASVMQDTMQKVFQAIQIFGTKTFIFFEKIGLQLNKLVLGIKKQFSFGDDAKKIEKELSGINKQLDNLDKKQKSLDVVETVKQSAKAIDDYRKALYEFENQTAKTSSRLAILRGEEERLSERTGDMTLSFQDQLKAQTQYNAKVKERIEVEKQLAELQLNEKVLHIQQQLIVAGANYSKQQVANLDFLKDESLALLISSERLSALAEAKALVTEKEQELQTLQAKNAMERRNTEKDLFEKQLDYAIDAFDVVKTVNERIINLENTTLAERERITEETRILADKSFNNQVKLVQDYTKKRIDFNKLIAMQDEEQIRKELDKFNLNETTLTRILEIIKERKLVIQDLSDLETETAKKRLDMNKAILESEQNITSDNVALQIELIEYRYDQELEMQNKLSTEKGKNYIKDYNKLKEIITKEIELRKQQLIQEAEFKKMMLDKEPIEEEEKAQKKKEIDQKLNNDLERLNIDFKKKINEIDKIQLDDEKTRREEYYNQINTLVKESADFFVEQSNRRIEAIDNEINAIEKQNEMLQEMAAQGNITAEKSLAVNKELQAKARVEREKEQRRQEQIKLAESVYDSYSANVKNGEKNPVSKTITDITLLNQFLKSLPAFYEGTETTVADALGSPLVSGKDGYVVRVDGSEKVLNPSLSKKTGNLTTSEIAKISEDRLRGKLMYSNELSMNDSEVLVRQLKSIEQTILNKPETSIQASEIIGGVMHIIESRKERNTTIRNIRRIK